MTKWEFISALGESLEGLPKKDIDERLNFYGEMIDDRIEEGVPEAEAVAEIGDVDAIAAQILAETPIVKLAKERIRPKRRLKAWEIVLLVVGSPIWLSLLITAVAVVISLYASLWSVIISAWAVFGSLVGASIGCLVGGIIYACLVDRFAGLVCVGAGLVCAGLSIFAFLGARAITKGALWLTKKILLGIKRLFIKKEEAR